MTNAAEDHPLLHRGLGHELLAQDVCEYLQDRVLSDGRLVGRRSWRFRSAPTISSPRGLWNRPKSGTLAPYTPPTPRRGTLNGSHCLTAVRGGIASDRHDL